MEINKKKIIIIFCVTLFIIAAFFMGKIFIDEGVIVKEGGVTETKGSLKSNVEYNIYDTMHRMANTKIEAIDGQVWGEIEITPELCSELIEKVNQSNFDISEKQKLIEILTRWKNGDFSKCVDEHNYVWKKLGGTIGRAIRLKK
ncbi:MAG: DUF6241 domain-containing protein [Clostridiales bacterium]|nr:DUF6241 domain-containing protein [Clostridiales bacterium]